MSNTTVSQLDAAFSSARMYYNRNRFEYVLAVYIDWENIEDFSFLGHYLPMGDNGKPCIVVDDEYDFGIRVIVPTYYAFRKENSKLFISTYEDFARTYYLEQFIEGD